MTNKSTLTTLLLGILLLGGCSAPAANVNNSVPARSDNESGNAPEEASGEVFGYRVISEYPHDARAFTQGLAFDNGLIYEGTGLYGKSTIRQVPLETGLSIKSIALASEYFGEGITIVNDKIIQLTWKSNTGFIYRQDDFKFLGTFKYPTEGWGVTFNGKHIIMSDGSDILYFLNPDTYKEEKRIKVIDRGENIKNLNELEFINGEIFANVWKSDLIARINPETGVVNGWVNLSGLLADNTNETERAGSGVLNGIAYDSDNDRLFVTGKLWPKIFEIELTK